MKFLILSNQDQAALSLLADTLATVLTSGDVLLLYGELGAGKTTFTQLLALALGVGADQYVASPSFALVHEYSGRLPIIHMDLYRLGDEEEVECAGLREYFEQPLLCIVEWPERLGMLAPAHRLDVHLNHQSPLLRQIILVPHGNIWQHKVNQIAAKLSLGL